MKTLLKFVLVQTANRSGQSRVFFSDVRHD